MTQTEAEYWGGARWTAISTTISLHRESDRIQRVKNTSGASKKVQLPTIANHYQDALPGMLGLRFIIMNDSDSTDTVKVRWGDGMAIMTLATLSPGEAVVCTLYRLNATTLKTRWFGRTTTIGTARAFLKGTHAGVVEATVPTRYTPFCYFGDPCVWLRDYESTVALDGTNEFPVGSGRSPEVLTPFFEDPHHVINQAREAIRAADVVMPSHVVIQFSNLEFSVDVNHPKYSADLSSQFYEALYNFQNFHVLAYDDNSGSGWNGESRHWHHIRRKGTVSGVWSMNASGGGLQVQRHIWSKSVSYGPAHNPTLYTMMLRVVLEHTVNPQPKLETGGGKSDADWGAHGGLLNLCVFTDEIDAGFVEGGTYTPAGGSAAVAFDREDPCVWGNAQAVTGGNDDDKFCHPLMAICGNVPTTFQSPIGSNWVPLEDRQYYRVFGGAETGKAWNREYCYVVGNGAPWSSLTCNTGSSPVDDDNGVLRNVVFGYKTGGTRNFAAMTVGGDVPKSTLTQFITLENLDGDGQTYLKPKRSGWDEDCGTLDVVGGSSVSIWFCTDDTAADWPACAVGSCAGHPDEPFGLAGGTHRCFNNNAVAATPGWGQSCCVQIIDSDDNPALQLLQSKDWCYALYTKFGDSNGSSCDVIDLGCRSWNRFWKQYVVPPEDYDYVGGGSAANRVMTWVRIQPDPDFSQLSYTYVSTSIGDFTQEVGTFTYNSGDITVATIDAAETATAVLLYSRAAHTYRDVLVATSTDDITKRIGIVLRGYVDASNDLTGYVGIWEPSGGGSGNVRIYHYVAGVATQLATAAATTAGSTLELSFECWGVDLTLTAVFSDGTTAVTAKHCTTQTGDPGLCTTEGTSGAVFGGDGAVFTLTDNTVEWAEVSATMGDDSIFMSFPANLHGGYNKCDDSWPLLCGNCCDPAKCNCTKWREFLTMDTSSSYTAGQDGSPDPCDHDTNTNGENPTYPGGPPPPCCEVHGCMGTGVMQCVYCDGNIYGSVGSPPFLSLGFLIFNRCTPAATKSTEPKICSGLHHWNFVSLVCA